MYVYFSYTMSYKYRSNYKANYHQQPVDIITAIIIIAGLFIAWWFIKLVKYIWSLSTMGKIWLIISLVFIWFIIGIIYLFIKSFDKNKTNTINERDHVSNSLMHTNSVSYNSSIIGKRVYPKTSFFIPLPITIDQEYTQIQKLREVHPKYFEDFISEMFKISWYTIEKKAEYKFIRWKRQAQRDWWIDLIAGKNGAKKYIQVKKLLNQEVWVPIIRELYGAITDDMNKEKDQLIVITTSLFSEDAQNFANEKWRHYQL